MAPTSGCGKRRRGNAVVALVGAVRQHWYPVVAAIATAFVGSSIRA